MQTEDSIEVDLKYLDSIKTTWAVSSARGSYAAGLSGACQIEDVNRSFGLSQPRPMKEKK